MVVDIVGSKQLSTLLAEHSDKVVLVDFWAAWCGPCRMLGPVLHEIADEHDHIIIAKVDVDEDENADLAKEYGVMSIPQVNKFVSGVAVDKFI